MTYEDDLFREVLDLSKLFEVSLCFENTSNGLTITAIKNPNRDYPHRKKCCASKMIVIDALSSLDGSKEKEIAVSMLDVTEQVIGVFHSVENILPRKSK